ncbi:centromere protein N-like [Gigaspora margarita]|uniref:Centromere protein N-like n=1 Tax=Gigaspora margarita TaxID=4874 RepID=A0A8H4AU03_GIGMA|nr:centromere protein N-like [Gigaspora margarita]
MQNHSVNNDYALFTPQPSLRRVINRHSKDSLLKIVKKWLEIPQLIPKYQSSSEENNENQQTKNLWQIYEKLFGNKKKIVDKIYFDDWKNGLTYLQVAQLDMKYFHDRPNLKQWKALKLCWDDGELRKEFRNKEILRSTLSKHLSLFFANHLYIEIYDKNWWFRISIHDGVSQNSLPINTNIIYLIYFTNSEHLLCSNVKREHKEFILQGLLKTFACQQIEECDLKGKYVNSLEQLLLHQKSQGIYSQYRLNQVDDSPLEHTSKGPNVDDQMKSKDNAIDDNFGPNEQPSLDVVEIKLDMPFNTYTDDHLEEPPISTTVVFEGSNVIEGVKKMVTSGYVIPPLPKFLVELHSSSKNYIEVVQQEN